MVVEAKMEMKEQRVEWRIGRVGARNARTQDPSNFSPRGPRHIGRCLKFVSRDGEERRRITLSLRTKNEGKEKR